MQVIWSCEAENDLSDIFAYIAKDNLDAAIKMDALFRENGKRLGVFPNLGREGSEAGTRELVVHKHYKLVYVVREDRIEILTILHTARKYH